jgi:phage host-nuclease inhibitor protein Gam
MDLTVIRTWEEVDEALREIAQITGEIEAREAAFNRVVGELREELVQRTRPLAERREALERLIREFAERHRAEFGRRKSVELNFGSLGFRHSTRLVVENVKAVVEALRARGMADYIVVKEDVDRQRLRRCDPGVLAELGVRLEDGETFWYEVRREKVAV